MPSTEWLIYGYPLSEWFFRYPLLLLEAGLMILIAWGRLEAGLGLPHLIWHENKRTQFMAGLGVALLFGELCFVGYLLEADEGWIPALELFWFRGSLWWYFACTWLPLLALFVAPAVSAPTRRWSLVVGVLLGAVATVVVGWLLDRLAIWIDGRFGTQWLADMLILRPPSEPTRRLHLLAMEFFVAFAVLYLALALKPQVVTSAVAACLLLGVVAAVYGAVVFHFQVRLFGVFASLVLVFVLLNGIGRYRHRFPNLNYRQRTDLASFNQNPPSAVAAGLLENDAVLHAWLEQQRAAERGVQKPKLVVVAASGGGIRAAVWTATVLARLEQSQARFPYRVRLVTGASGGILGAAYYVATLRQPPVQPGQSGHRDVSGNDLSLERLVRNIAQDSLSPTARHLVLRDVPLALFPGPYRDRGWAIEEAWEQNTEQSLAMPYRDLRDGEQQGWRPSLVFSPMLVEDGRRLLVSNLNLDFVTSNRGSRLVAGPPADALYSRSGTELFRLLCNRADSVRLSTVARMSASFPYISPDAVLPTSPSRRVVDAGYYDNYGVNVAVLWLYEYRKWLAENVAGVVLVQIRDSLSQGSREQLLVGRERSVWRRGLSFLTTPMEGVGHAWESAMSFRNDELVESLSTLLNAGRANHFFTTVVFELSRDAALSWYLTSDEFDHIRRDMDSRENQDALNALNAWW